MLKARIGLVPACAPNWSAPFEVEYNFKTGVTTAFDGSEQRESLRTTARVTLSFNTLLTQETRDRFYGDLAKLADQVFVLPLPWRAAKVVSVSGSVLALDAAQFWAVPGQPVVLSDDATEEVGVVSSASGNTVTLTAAVTTTTATRLHCARNARMAPRVRVTARTDSVWTAPVEFEAEPAFDPQPAAAITPATFEGLDLFLKKPNWGDSPGAEIESERLVFDSARGRIEVRNPVGYAPETLSYQYQARSALAAEEMIAFYLRQKGKARAFRSPTWRSDVRLAAPAIAGATTLEAAGTSLFSAFDQSPVYQVIYVNGQAVRVSSLSTSGGNTVLTLADPLAGPVAQKDKVSWCPICRFAADRLEVRWLTTEVAEIQVALRLLPETENGGGA